MINIFVAGAAALLKPSASRSAATVSAGFFEFAAFGARHRFADRGGEGWRAGFGGDGCSGY